MGFGPRTVLVPLAGPDERSGRIARVQADGLWPEKNVAGLNPQISQLNDWQLYEAGAIALGAMRRLSLPFKGLALLHGRRRGAGAAAAVLSVTNGPEIAGLHNQHNQSAELGLALALLMYGGQSRDKMVIATGRLARAAGPGSALPDDVEILPVGGLAGKIEAIRRSLDLYRGEAPSARILFFLPARCASGGKTIDRHAAALQELQEAFGECGLELEICPVKSLREAACRLGIRAMAATMAERLLAGALAAGAALLLLGLLASAWLDRPLPLSFLPVRAASGAPVASPARARYDAASRHYVMQKNCMDERRLPLYRAGDWMIVHAGAGAEKWLSFLPERVHFIVVAVSEKSGIKVFPPATFRKGAGDEIMPPGELSIALPVSGPDEHNKIIILARRLLPFDAAGLQKRLNHEIAGLPPARYINRAVSFLAGQAPGYLDYSFLSLAREPACTG